MAEKPKYIIPADVMREAFRHFGSHRKAAQTLGRQYYFWRSRGFVFERGRDKAISKIKEVLNGK